MVDVEAHREEQRTLYGAPLKEVLTRCRSVLEVSQARLAALLGISAPMLSQLMSAQRIKIGNPAAVQRLQVMLEAVEAVERGALDVERALAQVAGAGTTDVLTGTSRRVSVKERAGEVQALFRRAASAGDHLAAAKAVEADHPRIAELLRVYGAGSEDDAVSHLSGRQPSD